MLDKEYQSDLAEERVWQGEEKLQLSEDIEQREGLAGLGLGVWEEDGQWPEVEESLKVITS